MTLSQCKNAPNATLKSIPAEPIDTHLFTNCCPDLFSLSAATENVFHKSVEIEKIEPPTGIGETRGLTEQMTSSGACL